MPAFLIRNTFKDVYIWNSQKAFEALDFSGDLLSIESDYISADLMKWDDERISEEIVQDYISICDVDGMREMIAKAYYEEGALAKVVPCRLMPYIQKILDK